MARLIHAGNVSSVSLGGKEIKPDKKGGVEVPDDMVGELSGHGLWPEGSAAPAPKADPTAALAEKDAQIADLTQRMAALEEAIKKGGGK